WSSVMLFNCEHPSNKALTMEVVNTATPAYLHQLQWLQDYEIGELPTDWNWLVEWHKVQTYDHGRILPRIIHYTEGLPFMEGFENCDYSDVWNNYKDRMEND